MFRSVLAALLAAKAIEWVAQGVMRTYLRRSKSAFAEEVRESLRRNARGEV